LLKLFTVQIVEKAEGKERPLVYRIQIPGKLPLFLLGAYHTQCGGCDGITDYKTIVPELLQKYYSRGHILFEGLLISGGYGSVGRCMSALTSKDCTPVWATLDTPLDLCLHRVQQRRAAKGKTEPLNPRNTEQKHRAAWMSHDKIASEYGGNCVWINHKRPVREVLALFDVNLPREPRHG
jgi:hypothetical protein